MFLAIFLYPLRKRWLWLSRQGSSRHWLDIHVLLGLSAPFIIAFHASFKFRGFAGMAFWFMLAVALSGIFGRYLYAQIPRSLSTAELSLRELQDMQFQLAEKLQHQELLAEGRLAVFVALAQRGSRAETLSAHGPGLHDGPRSRAQFPDRKAQAA